MAYGKKKKLEIEEDDDAEEAEELANKDEAIEGGGQRAADKEGKTKGKIAGGFGKGKKMNPVKHKLMMKLAKRK